MVEIEETEAHSIGDDDAERRLFREAHQRLINGAAPGRTLCRCRPWTVASAGSTLIPRRSKAFAVDLLGSLRPDNWNLDAYAAIAIVLALGVGIDHHLFEARVKLLWAAHYAASTGGRGAARASARSAGPRESPTGGGSLEAEKCSGDGGEIAVRVKPLGDEPSWIR